MGIIVEGFDGSGKTTLVKYLSDKYNMKKYWSGGPAGSILNAKKYCDEQLTMSSTVFDRVTCISEQCYNLDLAGISSNMLSLYLGRMIEYNLIIYCTGIGEESTDGFNKPGHGDFVANNIDMIKTNYVILMSITPHIEYDFKKDKLEDIEHLILSHILKI